MKQVHCGTDWEDRDSGQWRGNSIESDEQAMLRCAAFAYDRVRRSGLGDDLALRAAVCSVVLVSDNIPAQTVSHIVLRAIAWVKAGEIRIGGDF